MTSFSKWERDVYRARVGEEDAVRRLRVPCVATGPARVPPAAAAGQSGGRQGPYLNSLAQ